ncbi:MAG: 50S ribosome-binding GTPase [Phycisphaerales bacterium]|nr:50S ribosome-binding GTPase [Phycisphaerales bacterium]
MLDRTGDTIVAISSAPGAAPRGIVRVDGPAAVEVAERMIRLEDGRGLATIPGHQRVFGSVCFDADLAAPAVCYVFRAPRSYTRNDLIEIHTAGAPALLRMIVRRAVECSARQSEPGEFTARAFLNGAMDLSRAEAVAGVIRARDDRQLAAARQLRSGRLARRVERVIEALADLTALVEAGIDFADEPIEFITPAALTARVDRLDAELDELASRALPAERLAETPRVLLIGRPNAGKSTLMNALSGESRAICSDTAGTTRDILSARIRCGSMDVALLDAAGIDDAFQAAPDQAAPDRAAPVRKRFPIPRPRARKRDAPPPPDGRAAHEASSAHSDANLGALADAGRAALEHIGVVDAVLLVCDVVEGVDGALLSTVQSRCGVPLLLVLNKCDLLPKSEADDGPAGAERKGAAATRRGLEMTCGGPSAIRVSARHGDGLDELRTRIAAMLADPFRPDAAGAALLMTARHRQAVAEAREALARARQVIGESFCVHEVAELIAFELRDALDALGTITGAVTSEDLLGRIFAGFCIGK